MHRRKKARVGKRRVLVKPVYREEIDSNTLAKALMSWALKNQDKKLLRSSDPPI